MQTANTEIDDLLGAIKRMEIPDRFKDYDCADYFSSDKFTRGFYDKRAQYHIFYAAGEVVERPDKEFLSVGAPGVDGIQWGYRKRHPGLWAFHPIEERFQFLAPTLAELFDGWYSGRITV